VAPTATSSAAPAPLAPADDAPLWPWLAGGAVVVLGAGAFLLRRRQGTQDEPDYYLEGKAPTPPVAQPAPPASLRPAPTPQAIPEPALTLADIPAPEPTPQPVPELAPPPPVPRRTEGMLSVDLSANRLSATLMNTALTYELTITNTGAEAIGPIAVSGDMIGAHASIPPKVLLETSADCEPQHRIPRLEPGESASMSGELRLPLAAITPIRHGAATLFVPLARFRILVFRDGRPPVSANHAFVVGEEPATPGAALKPFRLDLGPRLYSGITQRELALPG
jgi:hypothetical protein